jgi:hypothetical protein
MVSGGAHRIPRGGEGQRSHFSDLHTDIKEATVVTLYLLPDVNLRLRPKLLADLKPGTRIVSHNYDMGDWKPLQTIIVKVPEEHTIYYWVVPPKSGSR